MLGRGGKSAGAKSLDPCRGENRAEIGILAKSLDDPSPPAVARQIRHRRESPVHTHIRGFAGGRFGGPARQARVERRCFSQGNRKLRAETVDDVETEKRRDLEARFSRQ
jgi:hypothetical protein